LTPWLSLWPGMLSANLVSRSKNYSFFINAYVDICNVREFVLISAVINSFNLDVFHVRAEHIDASNAQWLRGRLLTAIAGGERRMVVDLAGVQSIDASGINALLTAQKALRGHGALTFVSLSAAVAKALRASGADQVFQISHAQHSERDVNGKNPENLFTASLSPSSMH